MYDGGIVYKEPPRSTPNDGYNTYKTYIKKYRFISKAAYISEQNELYYTLIYITSDIIKII